MEKILRAMVLAVLFGGALACVAVNRPADDIRTVNHVMLHVSTLPANNGEPARIYVREKMLIGDGSTPRPVVLMVHGGGFTGLQLFVLDPGGDRIELRDES